MNQIGVDSVGVEIKPSLGRAKDRPQRLGTALIAFLTGKSLDAEVAKREVLIAEATYFHRHQLGQFAAQVVHMDACPAVGVGRIFVGEEKDFHAPPPVPSCGRLTPIF